MRARAAEVTAERGWPAPCYDVVYGYRPGHRRGHGRPRLEGTKRYREVFDPVCRREAKQPNEIWRAGHTQLDLCVLTPSGKPTRPWLTVIEDVCWTPHDGRQVPFPQCVLNARAGF